MIEMASKRAEKKSPDLWKIHKPRNDFALLKQIRTEDPANLPEPPVAEPPRHILG